MSNMFIAYITFIVIGAVLAMGVSCTKYFLRKRSKCGNYNCRI